MSAVLNSQKLGLPAAPEAAKYSATDETNAAPDSVASATERLARSRQQLTLALAETVAARRPSTSSNPAASPAWMNELKAVPGVGIVIQALSAWWAKYPLNAASAMAYDTANAVAKPLATRHPIAMVLGAVVLGGVLAWSRPWRWILKPALFAGLMAQLSAKLVAQVPLQSWMSLLTALAQGRGNSAATFDTRAPDAAHLHPGAAKAASDPYSQ